MKVTAAELLQVKLQNHVMQGAPSHQRGPRHLALPHLFFQCWVDVRCLEKEDNPTQHMPIVSIL